MLFSSCLVYFVLSRYDLSFYLFLFFFFNDTATTEIYTLSLHDALPIYGDRPEKARNRNHQSARSEYCANYLGLPWAGKTQIIDRKSTRLNSSHTVISYAVFCLKKKKKKNRK